MNNVYKQLESIIEHGIRNNPLPFKKGNSIRVGKIAIRHSQSNGYVIIDCETNKSLTTALTLRGALALAKSYNKVTELKKIKFLDNKYYKNYNDCIFYKSSIANTSNQIRKAIIQDRLELAEDEMMAVAKSLEDIIFDNKR